MPEVAVSACQLPQSSSCAIPQPPPLRWEWRTFDYQLERWARLLRQVELLPSPEPSYEWYLLTPASADNVKLRGSGVEVKRLLRTNSSGLELWQPAFKCEFPLGPDAVRRLCDVWGVELPGIAPVLANGDALVSWLTRALPEVRVIPVRKLRRRFRVLHCEGEWVTLEIGDRKLECLALEHHDPGVVSAALVALRLQGARNINYVEGLKRLLGWQVDAAHCVPAGSP